LGLWPCFSILNGYQKSSDSVARVTSIVKVSKTAAES